MSETTIASAGEHLSGTPLRSQNNSHIPVFALGMSLGIFLALTYVLCVAFDFLFPEYAMYWLWAPLLPGFTWISWPSFLLGLVETFAYGWYVALVFGPLYNIFIRRRRNI
jgi:hypothetical protein